MSDEYELPADVWHEGVQQISAECFAIVANAAPEDATLRECGEMTGALVCHLMVAAAVRSPEWARGWLDSLPEVGDGVKKVFDSLPIGIAHPEEDE